MNGMDNDSNDIQIDSNLITSIIFMLGVFISLRALLVFMGMKRKEYEIMAARDVGNIRYGTETEIV